LPSTIFELRIGAVNGEHSDVFFFVELVPVGQARSDSGPIVADALCIIAEKKL
jgi:hypothetical protein